MEQVKSLLSLFSTADAEGISFKFDSGDLELTFSDWKEVEHVLLFPDAVMFRWDELIDYEKFRDDCPHEIVNSEAVGRRILGEEALNFRHYMICFNAVTTNLEVISKPLEIVKPASTRSDTPDH